MDVGPSACPARISGSFRDPSGYVFERDGRIFRAVNDAAHSLFRELADSGRLSKLSDDGLTVPTRFVEDSVLQAALAQEHRGFAHFLEHERVPQITYPYEWSGSMLAAAGLLTLELQLRLLEAGCALKDASAYNVQFVEGRPVFIDLTSIERPARLDLWFALGQFQRMFLLPLLLSRHCGWDLRSYFLSSLDGRSLEQVRQSLSWFDLWRPSLFLDLTLPLLLERKANRSPALSRDRLERPNQNCQPQLLNLNRLVSKIRKLAARAAPKTTWSDYTTTCGYEAGAESAKKALVKSFLEDTRPGRVLDIGCNTGDYSFIAADCGAQVVAVDGDSGAIDRLYQRLRQTPRPISPMVIDLANPSPAIGFMNRERASFLDRIEPDCVLALALIHHLLVSANLSLAAIRDMFHALTQRHLILEFVPTDDGMFQRLMKFRVDLFQGLTLQSCLEVFTERFDVLQQTPIQGSPRTLFLLRKRP
jgi:ribosomal protein L11 methylase PrmA